MTVIASGPIMIGSSSSNGFAQIWSINDQDEVAGGTAAGGALWQNGQTIYMPVAAGDTSGLATSVNDQGEAVGYSNTSSSYHSFLWQNGTSAALPSLGGSNRIFAITDQGVMVGSAEDANGLAVAVEIRNGTVTQLGELPGGYLSVSGLAASRAFSINDLGQIVGISLASDGVQHAALWQNGTVTDLGGLPGGGKSFAYKINNHGVAVGFAVDANGIDQAVVWQNGAMNVLPDHQSDGHSIAYGINDAGIIVGRSDLYRAATGWQDDAVIWRDGILIDLNSFLPTNSGWILNVAQSINDNGEIAGMGTYNGVATAFVMSIGDSAGPMVSASAALQSFKAAPHGAAVSVLDGAAAIQADLDALQGMASMSKLLQVEVSDQAPLTVTEAQLDTDAEVLADLSGSYSLHLTGVTANDAWTYLQKPHVTAVGITDSASSIWVSLDQLQSWAAAGELTSISLTAAEPPILHVSADQVVNDQLALKDVQGSYKLEVSGASVAQALAFNAAYSLSRIEIRDTIDAAASAAGVLGALNATYSLELSGSAADLAAHLDALAGLKRPLFIDVTVTDTNFPTISITAAQYADASTLFYNAQGKFVLSVDASQQANATISGPRAASVVVFPDPVSDYALATWGGNFLSVTDTGTGRASTDHIGNVTALQFQDGVDFIVQAPSATGVTSGNVAELYAAVLSRTPDVAGLAYYQQLIQGGNGPSMLQLAQYFLSSPEYTGNAAHAYAQSADGDAHFIADTYENLLHRAPDSGAVPFYQKVVAQFTAGLTPGTAAYAAAQTQGHAQVLVYFSASAEFLTDVRITAQHPADAQHWLYVI